MATNPPAQQPQTPRPGQISRVSGTPPRPDSRPAGSDLDEPERTDFNAGDARSVAERAESAKQRELRRVNGLNHLLSSADGRLWLWELLTFCGIAKTSFDGTSRTYFNEGGRNVGLRIQADLTSRFPEKYVQMLREEGGLK